MARVNEPRDVPTGRVDKATGGPHVIENHADEDRRQTLASSIGIDEGVVQYDHFVLDPVVRQCDRLSLVAQLIAARTLVVHEVQIHDLVSTPRPMVNGGRSVLGTVSATSNGGNCMTAEPSPTEPVLTEPAPTEPAPTDSAPAEPALEDSAPAGRHTVTVALTVTPCAEAIDFYIRAFGAVEIEPRMTGPDGVVGHAEIRVGDSVILLGDEWPEGPTRSPHALGGTTAAVFLYVDDVELAWARAIEAGAEVVYPLEMQFYGDKGGRVRDPFGHTWGMAQHIEDVDADEMKRRMAAFYEQL